MSKQFKAVIPAPFQPIYENFKYAPAVIVGDQVHVSGLLGLSADGALADTYEQQVENIFSLMELILTEAGATLNDVFSITSYHVGDLAAQMPGFIQVQSDKLGKPHPAWTAVGVPQLAVEGAKIEVSLIATLQGK